MMEMIKGKVFLGLGVKMIPQTTIIVVPVLFYCIP